ncbi:MAG: dockerin type I domain-containing protein [Clostridiales bacterium]|nr:dockerin type I domain-containing protein [Clostridiales bacterium]
MKYTLRIPKMRIPKTARILFGVALVVSVLSFLTICYANTPKTGTITADGNVRVRTAPISGGTVTMLSPGTQVRVISETAPLEDGYVWYQVEVSSGNAAAGYIRSDLVTLSPDAAGGADASNTPTEISGEDAVYLDILKQMGFPDSYCNSILLLHKKYPNWQFIPIQTGLNWSDVIREESVAGRNLVQSIVNDARKSTDPAAYNWKTNTWYGYDGVGWVCASPEYIAYCMDPRNFLNETYIFQFETLEYAPYQNAAGVSNLLKGTFMAGNYTDTDGQIRSYADTFAQIGSSLGVSPYHLAARCKQEQGTKGTSPLISGKYPGYEGYYNYFNVRAYTTAMGSATVNGLAYAKAQGWNSIYKSIAGGSAVVANNYVKKGQNTIYFEKFNVVYQQSLYSHQYMTNVQAAMSEGSSMGKAHTDKNQSFLFCIPVYQNMPESPVAFVDKGNPNNWLSSLTVNGYNLTPGFDGGTTEYSVVVGEEVSTITVEASAVASTSKVSGAGTHSLNYGNNTIAITCTSQSGDARVYTITVARQQPVSGGHLIDLGGGAGVSMPYAVGTYVTGFAPQSSVDSVKASMSLQNCTVKILKADGTENTENIGTGNQITFYGANGAVLGQYEAVVYGDINGDGKISNVDVVMAQRHILGISTQTGSYLEAANASRDGGVSNRDIVMLQRHMLGLLKIVQ